MLASLDVIMIYGQRNCDPVTSKSEDDMKTLLTYSYVLDALRANHTRPHHGHDSPCDSVATNLQQKQRIASKDRSATLEWCLSWWRNAIGRQESGYPDAVGLPTARANDQEAVHVNYHF